MFLTRHPLITLICCCIFFPLFSQKDSSSISQDHQKSSSLKALQFDWGSIPNTLLVNPSQQELQAVIPNDVFLNKDLTGFTKAKLNWITGRPFNMMVGFKLFLHQSRHLETFVGARYGQLFIVGTTYQRTLIDTTESITDPFSGNQTFSVKVERQYFNFGIHAHRIFIPLGANVFTDQRKLFWLSAGFEICPFVNFKYQLESQFVFGKWEEEIEAGAEPKSFDFNGEKGTFVRYLPVKGYSIGFYFGIPVVLHFHPFVKEQKFLSRFHAFGSLMPMVVFNSTQFGKPNTRLNLGGYLGIRYQFP